MEEDVKVVITEEAMREKLLGLKKKLDQTPPSNPARLPNKEEELYWLIAERFLPELIEELFPDWLALPASASFCLERKSRRN